MTEKYQHVATGMFMFSLQYLQWSAFRDIEVAIDFSFNLVGEALRVPWVSILSPTDIDSGAYSRGFPPTCRARWTMADHLSKKKEA